jgi:hypothetical protein
MVYHQTSTWMMFCKQRWGNTLMLEESFYQFYAITVRSLLV